MERNGMFTALFLFSIATPHGASGVGSIGPVAKMKDTKGAFIADSLNYFFPQPRLALQAWIKRSVIGMKRNCD
jgi:hypothetical protein